MYFFKKVQLLFPEILNFFKKLHLLFPEILKILKKVHQKVHLIHTFSLNRFSKDRFSKYNTRRIF